MKIHVNENEQTVRIEWGKGQDQYARVSPTYFERPELRVLGPSLGENSVTVYQTPEYTVHEYTTSLAIRDPEGNDFLPVHKSRRSQAQQIVDALNAQKEVA